MAFNIWDVRPDTPINNFVTMNPLAKGSGATLTEGNLKVTWAASDNANGIANSNFKTPKSGMWYWEICFESTNAILHGLATKPMITSADNTTSTAYMHYGGDGSILNGVTTVTTGYLSASSTLDVIGVCYDADNKSLYFRNSSGYGNSGNPETGTNPAFGSSYLTQEDYFIFTGLTGGSPEKRTVFNFGQDPTFSNNKTPTKVYTDSNGQGRFFYEPPAGALALCTRNLATPKNVPAEYIVDETNQHLLTYNGNAQISKFSSYATDGYSMYSTETTGVNFGSVSDFNFLHDGTTSYTISGWIYRTKDSGSAQLILDTANFGSGNIGVYYSVGSNNLLNFQINRGVGGSAAAYFESNYAVPLNQWIYFAITHDTSITSGNDRIKLYINGVESGYNTRSYNYNNSASNSTRNLHLGVYDGASLGFPGYISDLRIIQNVDAANYAVPTSYVSSTGTDFLLSANSKQFVDSSSNAYTSTLVGSPEISDWSPYTSVDKQTGYELVTTENGGSFYFDGSGDYLSNNDVEFYLDENDNGSSSTPSNFSFNFWTYLTDLSAQYRVFFSRYGASWSYQFVWDQTNKRFWFNINSSGSTTNLNLYFSHPAGLNVNQWYHISFRREGTGTTSSTYRLYLDGIQIGGDQTDNGKINRNGSSSPFRIGTTAGGTESLLYPLTGYIADFKLKKGAQGVYLPFNESTTPPPNKITADANTKLLLQPFQPKDKINSSFFNVTDNYAQDETGKALTYVGNAAVSASSPYKSGDYGSFSFNNTSSLNYIKLAQSSDWTPGTNSPYTIEFWYKTNVNIGTNHPILTTAGWSSNFLNRWQILSSSDKIAMWASNGSGNMFVGATSLTPGKWYHVAVVQDASSNWKLYLNGVQDASGTDSGYTTDSYLEIGANSTLGATYGVKGVIADLRIVKGAALYTADFTPPYAPLTTAGSGTTVLLAQPGKVADSENVAAKDPDAYMKAVIWTGDGSNSRDIPIGFNPDFVWIKNRTGTANSHATFDSVRGFGKKHLWTDLTNGETANEFGHVSGVSNNNITVTAGTSDDTYVNNFGTTYVGWVWKAGGNSNTFNINDTGYSSYDNLQSANSTLPASSTSGMITPTRMSVNTKAGFSIIKWSGNDTAGAIYPHGLSQAPELIITKCTNASVQWIVYSSTVNSTGYLSLPDSFSTSRNSWFINNTQPSNSFITSGYSSGTQNDSSHDYITYCWHSVAGYSAFGSYTGTNHQDKGYRSLDFKPSFILIKDVTSSGNWAMFDNQRGPINPIDHCLLANSAAVETTSTTSSGQNQIDFLSNGFFIRCDNANSKMGNATGNTYIFIAFAETPVPYATAR